MDTAKIYHDAEGNERTIHQMIKLEPEWAAVKVQEGEIAFKRMVEYKAEIERLTAWLEWIAEHTILECNVPDDDFQYLNMPPNEGASTALNGGNIKDYAE